MYKSLVFLLIMISSLFAQEDRFYSYVDVSHSEPMYEYRDIPEQREYYAPPSARSYESNNSIGLDTVIGATAGVILGNQVGRGNGKTVAKVAGGLVGAGIANGTRDMRDGSRDYNPQYNPQGSYSVRTERVLVGYKNYFIYEGREYFKISYNPLQRVEIIKTIQF